MKLLRTIRLDPSDAFVFEAAAEPNEWAVSGAAIFGGSDPSGLTGKARAAFCGGFLGIGSFGWSTLVQIVEASEADRANAVEMLAHQLVDRLGCPDFNSAAVAAEEEIRFAESLCTVPCDTLIAVHRTYDVGSVYETFRTLRHDAGTKPARAFAFFPAEEGDAPLEAVKLALLARHPSK